MQVIISISQSIVLSNVLHAHASDKKLTEAGSAKFFVRSDGSSYVQHRCQLTDREIRIIQRFIKLYYLEMYERWVREGGQDFYQS